MDTELRRFRAGAFAASGADPESAGQRLGRHRRRHGDEHPAAQPGRGARGGQAADRPPPGDPGRADGAATRAGLPDRRFHPWPRGHPCRLRHRPWLHPGAGPRRDRGSRPGQPVDHRDRASLPGEQGPADRADRRAGAREEAGGHPRSARRVRPRRHPDRDRPEAGRGRRDRPEHALQDDEAPGQLRHEHAGDRRQPAPGADAARPAAPLPRPSPHRRDPALPSRPGPSREARPRPRGAAHRARPPRRGDRDDPREPHSAGSQGTPDRGLLAERAPGAGDPGHAPAAPDRPRAGEDRAGVPTPCCFRRSGPSSTRSRSATATRGARRSWPTPRTSRSRT